MISIQHFDTTIMNGQCHGVGVNFYINMKIMFLPWSLARVEVECALKLGVPRDANAACITSAHDNIIKLYDRSSAWSRYVVAHFATWNHSPRLSSLPYGISNATVMSTCIRQYTGILTTTKSSHTFYRVLVSALSVHLFIVSTNKTPCIASINCQRTSSTCQTSDAPVI